MLKTTIEAAVLRAAELGRRDKHRTWGAEIVNLSLVRPLPIEVEAYAEASDATFAGMADTQALLAMGDDPGPLFLTRTDEGFALDPATHSVGGAANSLGLLLALRASGKEEWVAVVYQSKMAKFNENHDERGRFSSGEGGGASPGNRVVFEVSPNPENAALVAEWEKMTPQERFTRSKEVAEKYVPEILKEQGLSGELQTQIGSFEDKTNASFSVNLPRDTAPEDIVEATHALGYNLSQKGMIAVGVDEFPGSNPVDAITIVAQDSFSLESASALYDGLRGIEVNGLKAVGGATTVGSMMSILNFKDDATGVPVMPTKALAQSIAEHLNTLGGTYTVVTRQVHSIYATEGAYGKYPSHSYSARGKVGGRSVPKPATDFRSLISREITKAFRQWLEKYAGREETQGELAKYSDDQPRDDHGRWSSEGGGAASTAVIHERLNPSDFNSPQDLLNTTSQNPKIQAADHAVLERGNYMNDPGVREAGSMALSAKTQEHFTAIANSQLNPDSKALPGAAPEAVILLGKPGSGKSNLRDALNLRDKHTIVDADRCQSKLPGYTPTLAGSYHEAGGIIAEQYLLSTAIRGGYNLALDMTGKNTEKMEEIAKTLVARGYTVKTYLADVNDIVSGTRAFNRFTAGGRYVPIQYALSMGNRPLTTFNALKKYSKESKIYDTSSRQSIGKGAGDVGGSRPACGHADHRDHASDAGRAFRKQDAGVTDSEDSFELDPEQREELRHSLREKALAIIAAIAVLSQDDLYKLALEGADYGGGLPTERIKAIAQDALAFNAEYAVGFQQDALDAVDELVDGSYKNPEELVTEVEAAFSSMTDRAERYAEGGGKQAWYSAVSAAGKEQTAGCVWNANFGPGSCADCMALHGQWMTWADFDEIYGTTACDGNCNCSPVAAENPEDVALEDLEMGEAA